MKKNLLKALTLMFVMIPCIFIFSSCKKNEDTETPPAQPKISSILASLAEDSEFEYIEDTNTLRFEYGSVDIAKDDFTVTATYDNSTTITVSEFSLDATSIENADVGTYEITFTYAEKTAKINVEIYPKAIAKPVAEGGLTFDYIEVLDRKIEMTPEITFDETTMEYVDGSVASATDVATYQIKIVPDKNHIWETFDDNNKEEVIFDWEIQKSKLIACEVKSLLFNYEENVTHTITFDRSREQFIPFDEYFEVTGTISATERNTYSFTVSLKPEKMASYEIFEIYCNADDYEYNADLTAITYYWKIV